MSAPTICQACGNPMLPKGNDICDACIAEGAREDPHDLTHKLWRLRIRKTPAGTCIFFGWGLVCMIIIVYYLCKQLL